MSKYNSKIKTRNPNIKYPLTDPKGDFDKSFITDIEIAVNDADINRVKNLINEKKVIFNVKDENGNSPIHFVLNSDNPSYTESSRLELIKLFYENGCPIPGNFNKQNITPLHLAIQNQFVSIVKFLIDNGSDTNKADNHGYSPIHYALLGKNTECKPKKTTKSIYGESSLKTSQLSDSIISELEKTIILIFKEEFFSNYLSHIKQSLFNFDKMYIEDFLRLKKIFFEDVSKIALENISDNEKQKKYQLRVNQIKQQIEDFIKPVISNTTSSIDIGFFNDGWSPSPDTPIVIKDYEISKLDNIDQKFREIEFDMNNITSDLNSTITQINNNSITVNNNIQNILMHCYNFNINSGVLPPNQIQINNIKNNLTINLPVGTFFLTNSELENFININIDDVLLNPLNINPPVNSDKVVRGDIETIKVWERRNIYTEPLPLSLDVDRAGNQISVVGPNEQAAINNGNRGIPFANRIFNIDEVGFMISINGANVLLNNEKSIMTKIVYRNSIIQTNFNKLYFNNNNLLSLALTIDNNQKYLHDIYLQYIPLHLKNIINMLNTISLLKKDLLEPIKLLKKTKDELLVYTKIHSYNDYYYSIEYAIEYCENSISLLNNISKSCETFYQKVTELYNQINKIIDVINRYYGLKELISFDNSFTSYDTSPIENISEYKINNLSSLPININEYSKKFKLNSQIIIEQDVIKSIQEELLIHVSPNNPLSFYITDNMNPVIKGTFLIYDLIIQPLTFTNIANNNNRNGLLKNFNPNIFLEKLKYNGQGLDNNLNYTTIDSLDNIINSSNNTKIGSSKIILEDLIKRKYEPLLPSIVSVFDEHLSTVKTRIIQNILGVFYDTNYDGYKTSAIRNNVLQQELTKTKINDTKELIKNNLKTIFDTSIDFNRVMYTMIAKLTDTIITDFINRKVDDASLVISNKFIKNILESKKDITEIIRTFILDPPLSLNEIDILRLSDKDYSLDLSNIRESTLDIIINEYLSTNLNIDSSLVVNTNLVKEINQQKDIYKDLGINYSSVNEQTSICSSINTEIIMELINKGVNLNQKDLQKLTPLRYAILNLNPTLVKIMIDKGSKVNSPSTKDYNGFTPLKFCLNTLKNRNITPELFYKDSLKRIEKNLSANQDFKNNIILHLETAFRQVLFLLNHDIYMKSKSYPKTWTFEKQQQLKILLKNNLLSDCSELSIINSNDEYLTEIIKSSTVISPLTNEKNKLHNNIEELKLKITQLTKQIDELNKEKNSLTNNVEKIAIDGQIRRIDTVKNSLNTELIDKETKLIKLDENIVNNTTTNKTSISDSINLFSESLKSIRDGKITDIYKKIFNKIINSVDFDTKYKYTGKEDYKGYNALWEEFSKSDRYDKSIENIGFILQKLSSQLAKSDSIQKNEFELIEDFLTSTTKQFSIDYFELSQTELFENYALKTVVDIITHSVRHVICSSMYLSIIKATANYVLTVVPDESFNTSTKNMYIKKLIKDLFETDGSIVPKLCNYIVGYLPKVITRYLLKVKYDSFDVVNDIQDIDQLINPIEDILINNSYFSISKDSKLIDSIKTKIFPFYTEILTQCVPQYKIVLDNYLKFCINTEKEINIINQLIKKNSLEV